MADTRRSWRKPEARKLFEDAQKLLNDIVSRKLLAARGVYGFFPANAVGDDVELYTDESRTQVLTTFHFLRQQMDKPATSSTIASPTTSRPKSRNYQLSTLNSPTTWAPSPSPRASASRSFAASSRRDHDDYNSIMAKALADRLAEAFAEYLHQRARKEWGFGQAENLTAEELIREKYRGIRPAAGYPACPDHTEKWTLWKLLDAEKHTGIKLTESCAMWPGASVSGLYFAHPESKYFAVGKIGRDQVLDYQRRKQMDLPAVERWLGPYLNYEPGTPAPAASPATAV